MRDSWLHRYFSKSTYFFAAWELAKLYRVISYRTFLVSLQFAGFFLLHFVQISSQPVISHLAGYKPPSSYTEAPTRF